ncbi:MAG: serpin family protein, partial [Myxococcales bacterium]|nr:serpin family protein [Myxococcales bacterium]
TINAWVEDATNDRIQDLLPEGSIGSDTRLVLTNAIYFKASWQQPFAEGATADAAFTLGSGEAVQVPTMHVSEGFLAHAGADYQAVRLPYFGDRLSMILVTAADLPAFEATLDADRFAAIRGGLAPAMLELSVPKFSFTTTLPLTQVLAAMGMDIAFTGEADFSGMNGDGGLMITDVLHKAFVGIDEEGTEAAAATAVVVGETSVPVFEPMAFDRPFLFFIVDEPTDSVLFLGRMADPR